MTASAGDIYRQARRAWLLAHRVGYRESLSLDDTVTVDHATGLIPDTLLSGLPTVVAVLPTASVANRGQVVLLNTGAGDTAYICLMKTGGTAYSWVSFAVPAAG